MAEFNADARDGGSVDRTLKAASKRIIVCCDGTWQSSVSAKANVPSNVTRLARYLTKVGRDDSGKEWQQLVYYDAGIGTGVSDFEAKRQGGTGAGFVGNVIEAYNFIVLNYNLGDQIFCFGFSRGAYTARAVAGLVTDIGIIRPRDMQDFPELFQIYQKHTDSHVFRKSTAWREWVSGKQRAGWKDEAYKWEKRPHYAAPESTRWVEGIGVFDTVGSLGIPPIEGLLGLFTRIAGKLLPMEEFGFHNVELSPFIRHAYHALALDEHRKPFSPALWHFPADDAVNTIVPRGSSVQMRDVWDKLFSTPGSSEAELEEAWENLVDAEMYEVLKDHRSHLLQVWFPGVHTNIGGGSNDLVNEGAKGTDFEQIAIVSLTWMVEQLRKHLAFEADFTRLANKDRFLLMRPVVEKLINEKAENHWLIQKINDIIAKDPKNDPWHDGNKTRTKVVAADALRGWATGPIVDSFAGNVTAAGSLDRTPGRYSETTLQDGTTLKLRKTNEYLHPTIRYRMEALGGEYRPVALLAFKRWLAKDKDGKPVYQWSKGDVVIPEWKIETADSYERTCAVSEASRAFLGHLDKDYGIDSHEARNLATPASSKQEVVSNGKH